MQSSDGEDRYPCSCFACTDSGRAGPQVMWPAPWFLRSTPEKRRRLSLGGTTARQPASPSSQAVSAGGSSGGGAPATPGFCSASGAAVIQGGLRNVRRCDADETPESRVAGGDVCSDEGPQDIPPPEIFQDPEPEAHDEAPLAPRYQTTIHTIEIKLLEQEFKDRAADLAL